MKKKIFIIVGVLIVLLTIVSIPKSTYQKWFGKNPVDNSNKEETLYQTVFVVDTNNKLVGVRVPVEKIEEDEITQKWNLLTANMNLIPSGYSSPVTPSTLLDNYEVSEGKLVLNVSEDITRSTGRLTIESLAWTFCNDEISEVVLKVDGKVLNTISDYNFKKITKTIGTNFTYETAYLYEADFTTIVFYENDLVKPVTYFYKDMSEYDFMISKVLDNNDASQVVYTYEIQDNKFVINFDENFTVSENIKQTLLDTVKLNTQFDTMCVNGIDTIIYEQVIEEIN